MWSLCPIHYVVNFSYFKADIKYETQIRNLSSIVLNIRLSNH